jgi:hypothetical protein
MVLNRFKLVKRTHEAIRLVCGVASKKLNIIAATKGGRPTGRAVGHKFLDLDKGIHFREAK